MIYWWYIVRLSELQKKDIIDIDTGQKIGNIIDAIIDNGTIDSLVVDKNNRFNIFSVRDEVNVKYSNIQKIGEDVIIVKI